MIRAGVLPTIHSLRKQNPMFKVGATYKITMWEADSDGGGESHTHGCKIIEVNFPNIKYVQPYVNKGKEVILNTASLAFVSATLESE
jgi:hypothetical protein